MCPLFDLKMLRSVKGRNKIMKGHEKSPVKGEKDLPLLIHIEQNGCFWAVKGWADVRERTGWVWFESQSIEK